MIGAVANHLWQSTLFAAAAALLTLMLRKNQAGARYSVWLAASLKFLVPFSLLALAGSQIHWRPATAAAIPQVAFAVEQVTPLLAPAALAAPAVKTGTALIAPVLFTVWAFGCSAVLFSWNRRWRRMRAALRAAKPVALESPVEVRSSASLLEPGVFGIFRPTLLWPDGIAERMTPDQLQAILAHEWTHVRRRDNLTAALHMGVEAIFWFHPLVWWIGARLVEERERACDEAVFSEGHEAEAYAEGILKVCRFYVESRLPCAAGVAGADLRKRIEWIMARRAARPLEASKRLLLATAAAAALAAPVAIGTWNAPPVRAQSQAEGPRPAFEVASIKPGDPRQPRFAILLRPSGQFVATNASLRQLISYAYDLRDDQVTGGPPWGASELYSVEAKPDAAAPVLTGQAHAEQTRLMLQSLLAARFELAMHRVSKEEPVYDLVVANNGPKLKTAEEENESELVGRNQITGTGVGIALLIKPLSQLMGRTIVDHTGLTGKYDFSVQWSPPPGPFRPGEAAEPPADPDGISVFTALQEQLGLKLEAAKGSVEILVIDRAEKPSEN